MEEAMEFKSATNVFEKKDRFADEMRRFVCDEAARFTTSGNKVDNCNQHPNCVLLFNRTQPKFN